MLNEYCRTLFIAFSAEIPELAWRSERRYDGTIENEGWFFAGVSLPTGQVTCLLPMRQWELMDHAVTLIAGHDPESDTQDDAIQRLVDYIRETR